MPKFLDAPSWYDNTGTLRTLSGTVRFNSVVGYVDLPYTTFASGGADSSYYVLTSTGTSGNIVYSSGACPVYLPNGTSGQVLTSNGNAAPSWGTPSIYLHTLQATLIYISNRLRDTVYITFDYISTSSSKQIQSEEEFISLLWSMRGEAGAVPCSGAFYREPMGTVSARNNLQYEGVVYRVSVDSATASEVTFHFVGFSFDLTEADAFQNGTDTSFTISPTSFVCIENIIALS